jgi:hypothetical protein
MTADSAAIDGPAIDPLVAEAVKKAAIAWLDLGRGPARALWCTWSQDALYVVCGTGEQADPGLSEVDSCVVTLRGDHLGRIVDVSAQVSRIRPDTPDWEPATTALSAKRLNASGAGTVDRWAGECAVYRLTPVAGPARHGDQLPSDSLAAVPVPSDAARPTRKPFRLHRVKRRNKSA